MITKLPIATPSVYTYLHHANPLSISELSPKSIDCLRNYFIQLYSIPTAPDFTLDFYHHDGMYPRYPFVDSSWISAKMLAAMGGDTVNQFKVMLDSNCYVEAYLNEIHLSASHNYRRRDWVHNNMIYGYSDEAECFYAQGFTRHQTFGLYEIPYSELAPALPITSGVSLKSTTPHAKYNNTLDFQRHIAQAYLEDYLASTNRFLTFKPQTACYGQATYEIIINKIEESEDGRVDIRPWHLYLEHKRKLKGLAKYIAECDEQRLDPQMEIDLQHLEDDTLNVRNYIMDCITRGRSINIDALKRNVNFIIKNECQVLQQLLHSIQTRN